MAGRSEGPRRPGPPAANAPAPTGPAPSTLKPGGASSVPIPPRERPQPEPAAAKRLSLATQERSSHKEAREHAEETLLGDGRIGDERVTSADLASMGSLVAARHVMVLLAKKRHDLTRETVLKQVGDLLIGLDNASLVRRILLELPDAGRIVDIYPLEVLAYVRERRPDLLPDIHVGPIILNKTELESMRFKAEEAIVIKVPLSLKMRGFALEGGGTPGYCFSPGAPGEYRLELGAGGTFRLLVRGDVRKKILLDRVVLRVEDPPEGA